MMRRTLFVSLLVILGAMPLFAGTGKVVIINNDIAGTGFNDPTPATPVGGNTGTTVGQQRFNVFLAAGQTWQNNLDTNVDVRVRASFAPISGCTDTEGVLGQASPMDWRHDTAGVPVANVWYPIALANKFANQDLSPNLDDINIQFNADVDKSTCLGATNFYYGLDNKHGNDIDLFNVVLHEMGHGFGISGKAGAPNFSENRPAISDIHTLDTATGLRWDQMSIAQRNTSMVNTGNLVWDGAQVRSQINHFLDPMSTLTISAPSAIAKNYDVGLAAFGPTLDKAPAAGRIVTAQDEANTEGPSTTDGCSTFSNASAVAGRIALIDRGLCTFVSKSRNAQNAGAIGVIIVDNVSACSAPALGGSATDVTIPVISITQADGNALKAQLTASANVDASLHVDPSQLAGATKQGYLRLYAPCTFEPGSSVHHWDTAASPNLLMEPFIGSDLLHGLDLTIYQLFDMGWTQPPRSGRRILKK
jgi:hypothetical protein